MACEDKFAIWQNSIQERQKVQDELDAAQDRVKEAKESLESQIKALDRIIKAAESVFAEGGTSSRFQANLDTYRTEMEQLKNKLKGILQSIPPIQTRLGAAKNNEARHKKEYDDCIAANAAVAANGGGAGGAAGFSAALAANGANA